VYITKRGYGRKKNKGVTEFGTPHDGREPRGILAPSRRRGGTSRLQNRSRQHQGKKRAGGLLRERPRRKRGGVVEGGVWDLKGRGAVRKGEASVERAREGGVEKADSLFKKGGFFQGAKEGESSQRQGLNRVAGKEETKHSA